GSPEGAGHGRHRDGPPRPALAGPGPHPFEHEVPHDRRRDDVVLGLVGSRPRGAAQRGGEVGAPVAGHEPPIGRFAQLRASPAPWIPVHHHDAPIVGPAPRFCLRELAGVERAVAATADHHDVAHGDHAGQTSPATGRISPVTAPAASLARNSTAFTTWSSSTQCTLASFTWARLAAVFTMPGATAFTRTLRSASSRARARVSPATAALAALYDAMWRWGLSTATDAKFTIAPPPRSSSAGIAACETRNAVARLTATSRSSCSGRTSSTGPRLRRPPATFTTTSRPPNACFARATARPAVSGVVRSPATARTATPLAVSSVARSATTVASWPTMMSWAPAAPKPRATACPICPTRPTPVMRATLPRKSPATASALPAGHRGDDLVGRRRAPLREGDGSIAGHHVDGALNAVGVVLERVIRPGDRPVGIGQQGKIEAQLGGVAPATPTARRGRRASHARPRARYRRASPIRR